MHVISFGVILGLGSSITFGLLDVLISFASRFIGMLLSLVIAQAISALVLLFVLVDAFTPGLSIHTLPVLLFVGVGLGTVNAFANLSLYKGLAIGPLALVSPISASYGLVTTLLAVYLFHEVLGPLQSIAISLILAGIFLAATDSRHFSLSLFIQQAYRHLVSLSLIGIIATCIELIMVIGLSWAGVPFWLILPLSLFVSLCALVFLALVFLPFLSFSSMRLWWSLHRAKYIGLLFALGSTVGFGVEFLGNSIATVSLGPVQPILWSRLCSLIILLIYATRKQVRGWSNIKLSHLGVIALIALLDTLGMFWYNLGTSQSATSIVAMLSSTYMLLPMLVGIFVYRERLAPLQWSGVGSLMIGVVMLSLAGK